MNHHFLKNNSFYSEVEHPRWGVILSVRVSEEEASALEIGDELFTYYGYGGQESARMFPWYKELYHQLEPEILALEQERRKKAREATKEWKEAAKKREQEKEKRTEKSGKKKKTKDKKKKREN